MEATFSTTHPNDLTPPPSLPRLPHNPLDHIHRTPSLRLLPFSKKFTCPACQQDFCQESGWPFKVK